MTDSIFDDDGQPVGSFSWGRNIDGRNSPNWQVIKKINNAPGLSLWARYHVVLEVSSEWKAKAIAGIINTR